MGKLNDNEMRNFIRMIVIVGIVFLVFYLITVLTTGNKKASYTKKESAPAAIQYDEIIVGDIYNQNETEYYVLVEEKEDPYLSLFNSLLTQHAAVDDGIPYYTIDLSSAFNQKYYAETSSFEAGNLKFSGTTLLKIKDRTIIEYYQTSDEILNLAKGLSK